MNEHLIDIEALRTYAAEDRITLTDEQLEQFDCYAKTLADWNNRINLTSILDARGILVKHFLDSLKLCEYIEKPDSFLIDVGAGAGFPSLPCKIARPEITLTLMDSLQKRVKFLGMLCETLGVTADPIHGRAEECSRMFLYRERYDIATARAVAHLRDLTEYCLPFIKVGGQFVALKSSSIDDELSEAKNAIKILGGEIEKVDKFMLPDDNARSIVVIRKVKETSDIYPRIRAKMLKHPL